MADQELGYRRTHTRTDSDVSEEHSPDATRTLLNRRRDSQSLSFGQFRPFSADVDNEPHTHDNTHMTLPSRSITTNSIPDAYTTHHTRDDSQAAPALHHRTPSGEPGVAMPLLAHTRSDSYILQYEYDQADAEFGAGERTSMAGVGSARGRGRVGSSRSSMGVFIPPAPPSSISQQKPTSQLPPPPTFSLPSLPPIPPLESEENGTTKTTNGHEFYAS